MVKRLLILLIALVFFQLSETYAQITIGTVDAGPYTPGSSITATFSLGSTSCIRPGSQFELFLSDATGNFGSEVRIGTFNSFYSTFVNGVIPNGTVPGTGYKVRIKSTNPALVSAESAAFEIRAGASVSAQVSSAPVIGTDMFGFCPGRENQAYNFTNQSTATSSVTATITNELNNTVASTLTFAPPTQPRQFIASLAHYTVFVKAEMPDGSVATKAYMLVNNNVFNSFSTTGSNVVCLPGGFLQYGVDVSASGILNNYPGNTYEIIWGDGVTDTYTFCDLKSGFVRHEYLRPSCGNPPYSTGGQTIYNVFGINISVISPCGPIGGAISTYVRVVTKPENRFSSPEAACTNSAVTFTNNSIAGQNPGSNTPACSDNNVLYNWYVDGVLMLANVPRSTDFVHTFTTHGVYDIKLESITNGACEGVPVNHPICIQDPPRPAFDFGGAQLTGCAPFTIQAFDRSVIDAICNVNNTYNWIVNGPPGVQFDPTARNPVFIFNNPGSYEIILEVQTASCGAVRTQIPQQIILADGPATAVLSPNITLCALKTLDFNTLNGPTKTEFSGTQVDFSDTYTWSITAPDGSVLDPVNDYLFANGTNKNSREPSIQFKRFIPYKVSVTHKNTCTTVTASQIITFSSAPEPKIALIPKICYNASASLDATSTVGTYNSFIWTTTGDGTFSHTTNTLTPTYTPGPTDLSLKKATVTLTLNTGIEGDCKFVSVNADIDIYPNNTGTDAAQTICTGSVATLALTSTVPGSTYSWVATNPDGNAPGFTPSGTTDISQIINNTSLIQNAVIVYTITPSANGCAGVPFTFTVTVTPKPIINTLELDKTICDEQPVAIKVTSNIPTRFIWTSVPSAGISGNTNPTTKTAALTEFTIPDALTNDTFSPGTVTYTIKSYSDSDTECPGNELIVVVKVEPKVTQANAGPDESICATSPSNTYTLKGNKPDVGTGQWRLVSTHTVAPVIAVPTDFETTVSGLVAGQPYTFEWAITGTGMCDDTKDEVIITITPIPVISAPVTDKTICHNNPVALTINSDIQAQFSWTSTATPGITGNTGAVSPTALSPLSTNITINDVLLNSTFLQGTVTYTIIPYSAAGCPGQPIVIAVKVDPAVTIADAGTDASLCPTTTYDLKGSEPKVGTGLWELVSSTAGTPAITTPTNFETAVTGLVNGGVYTFKWTITGTGQCQKSDDEVIITVNMPTVAGTTATAQQLVCQNNNGGPITLSGNTGSVLGWQWSADGTVWTDIPGNTGSTYTFDNLSATTQFRAVVQNAGCSIEYSTPTIITVAPTTTIADAGPDQILCAESSVLLKGNLVKTGETGVWTMISGDANALITPGVDSEATVTELAPGVTYVFRWTITGNAPCDPTLDEVTVRNNAPIDRNSISTSSVVCNGQQVVVDGTVPTGGDGNYTYFWESKIGAEAWTVVPNEINEDLTTTLTTSGQISFRRTVSSGGCSDTSNEFEITVQPPITGNSITGDQTICSGITPSLMTDNGTLAGGDGTFQYQWQSSPDGAVWSDIVAAQQADYQAPALTTTTFYRRLVSTLACTGALQSISDTLEKTVNPNAQAEFTYPSLTSCAPFALQVRAVTYQDRNATYTWFANADQIGTGPIFPGYTINNSGESVNIRLVVTSSLGCSADEFSRIFSTNQAVPASFTPVGTVDCGPLTINFVNTSLQSAGATFRWNFGNGQTSNLANPQPVIFQPHSSGKDTTYTVTLYSITTCGVDSAKGTVLVKSPPKPVFSPSTTSGCSPLSVNFTNNSPLQTGIEYFFDFGDGTAVVRTTDRSTVTHIYRTTTNTQTFNATLTAVNQCGTVTTLPYAIVVRPNTVNAELVVNGTQLRGCAPFTVTFDNNSTGATDFIVDFKDGTQPRQSIISPERFTHTFTAPGTYDVTLTATNGCSTGTTTETIIVLPQPLTDFEADQTLGCPGMIVKFKNNTQNGVSYIWDFGDGSPISNEFEPTHPYTGNQEYYTVTLTATNNLGCTMAVTKNQYIHIVQPPIAAFHVNPSTLINIPDYTFRFEDESTNTPTIWEWDFGDGTGSALKNPSHTYLDTGTYRVTLKTINQQGCFTSTFKNVTIKGVPGYLFVPNSFVPGNTQPELREFRAKGSGMATWRFSIFNKWGQLLWETTKLEEGRPVEGWDGTFKGQQLPQGVYYWKIDVQMVNGSEWKGMTYDSSAPRRTGAIHLIR